MEEYIPCLYFPCTFYIIKVECFLGSLSRRYRGLCRLVSTSDRVIPNETNKYVRFNTEACFTVPAPPAQECRIIVDQVIIDALYAQIPYHARNQCVGVDDVFEVAARYAYRAIGRPSLEDILSGWQIFSSLAQIINVAPPSTWEFYFTSHTTMRYCFLSRRWYARGIISTHGLVGRGPRTNLPAAVSGVSCTLMDEMSSTEIKILP